MSGGEIIILGIIILFVLWAAFGIAASAERKAKKAQREEVQAEGEAQFKPLVERFEQELRETWPVWHMSGASWRERNYLLMSKDQLELAFVMVKWRGETLVDWKERVDLRSVVSAELQQSETTIMRLETTGTTKKSGALARAAVGGALLGGAGAIVGAASAGSTTVATTTSKSETLKGPVYLVLGTTDLHVPLHKFKMNSRGEGEKWLHRVRGGLALLESR